MADIYFILVEPAVPGNIGASARAIKTMGFRKLRLVNPADHLNTEARTLAHGSHNILEQAEVFDTLEAAIHDLDFVAGTSARHKKAHHDYFPLDTLPGFIKTRESMIRKAGIVFGKEESGLSNTQLRACDVMVYIPMQTDFPSLNLSQAVMICAYTLFKGQINNKPPDLLPTEPGPGFRHLAKKIEDSMNRIGILKGTPLYHRIRERISLMEETDIHLLLSVIKHLDKTLNK
ncbi:MAG: tRNA/rRNA methyltransferase [Bacteroidales bacterium]